MSFSSDIAGFRLKTLDNYRAVKRMSAFDLFSAIILETPVDKGVLRNNWFVSMGSPSLETTEAGDAGQGPISRTEQELNSTSLNKDIFFTNNLKYATVIEFGGYPNPPIKGKGMVANGFSRKAPEGMVRVNALRWKTLVENNVKVIQNGR